MKLITSLPVNCANINNFDLRSTLNNDNIFLKAEGYVGNRPKDFVGEHEDDTWAIDQYDEDICINSYIYSSVTEYIEDCVILGLV